MNLELSSALPAAITHGTILQWLPDRSGFIVSLADGFPGVLCPRCPTDHGVMGVCIVRQRVEPAGRLVPEYFCLRHTFFAAAAA